MADESLTNRLVTAAAEGARRERIRSLRETGRSATDNAQAAQSVILVLRELAEPLELAGVQVDQVIKCSDLVRLAEVIEKGEQT